MFTNRKRDRFTSALLLSSLRRRAHVYTSPYHLSEAEQYADLTPETIIRHRRALRRSRRRRSRARRSAAAELTRLSRSRLTLLYYLCHILLHPTSLLRLPFTLLRRPRFLCRNKKRWHLRLRRPAPQPQPS